MTDLNKLSPAALKAAMIGGTEGWGQHGCSIDQIRYAEAVSARSRRRCRCGCKRRATYSGKCNGVSLVCGCELAITRWIKTGRLKP